MVACGATKEDNSAAIGLHCPPVSGFDWRFRLGNGQPRIALRPMLRLLHGPILFGECVAGTKPALSSAESFATMGLLGRGN